MGAKNDSETRHVINSHVNADSSPKLGAAASSASGAQMAGGLDFSKLPPRLAELLREAQTNGFLVEVNTTESGSGSTGDAVTAASGEQRHLNPNVRAYEL